MNATQDRQQLEPGNGRERGLSDQRKSRQKQLKRRRADKCKGWAPTGRGQGELRIIEVDRTRKPEDQTRH